MAMLIQQESFTTDDCCKQRQIREKSFLLIYKLFPFHANNCSSWMTKKSRTKQHGWGNNHSCNFAIVHIPTPLPHVTQHSASQTWWRDMHWCFEDFLSILQPNRIGRTNTAVNNFQLPHKYHWKISTFDTKTKNKVNPPKTVKKKKDMELEKPPCYL